MNKEKTLLFQRNIFIFIIFIAFGVIIVNEKTVEFKKIRVKEKINTYIDNNYKNTKKDFLYSDIKYKNATYTMKVTSKINKNYYFYINYNNRKITDTYDEDYIKGKTLIKKLNKKIEKDIKNTTNIDCDVNIISDLNDYTKSVQKRIIEENNLTNLKFYSLKKEILINNWTSQEISEKITKLIHNLNSKNITPNSYKIIITNKNNITESIEISNITEEYINNPYKEHIINDIINNNNSQLLKNNKITYKDLN